MPRSPMAIAGRLAAHVLRSDSGCLLWTGAIDRDGYGILHIVTGSFDPSIGRSRRSWRRAHVLAFEEANGPVPIGIDVGHTCHDADKRCPGGACAHRACLDLSHLALQTRTENNLGGRLGDVQRARHAAITHCPQGHPYDEGNTYHRSDRPHGGRQCRTCLRTRQQAKNAMQSLNV